MTQELTKQKQVNTAYRRDATESHQAKINNGIRDGVPAHTLANDEGDRKPRNPSAPCMASKSCNTAGNDSKKCGNEQGGNHNDHDESDECAYNNSHAKKHTEKKLQQGTFPQQLMDVIELESQHDKPILEWVDCGNAFVIRDKEAFKQKNVVPKRYFRFNKCKFASFVRKLYRQVSTHRSWSSLFFFITRFMFLVIIFI